MTLSNSEPSSLLSAPLSGGVRAEVKYFRPNTESFGYENQSKQFRLDNVVKSYNNQYYKVRLYSVEQLPSVARPHSGLQCETEDHEAAHCRRSQKEVRTGSEHQTLGGVKI